MISPPRARRRRLETVLLVVIVVACTITIVGMAAVSIYLLSTL